MNVPIIKGIIDRRLLVNFRVDPATLSRALPPPFRPQMVNGFGIAGICLIRLKKLHPTWLPSLPGWSSENAAHRIAVEWDHDGEECRGVYIPRRDTNSRLAVSVGGRLFPGIHHHARFDVREDESRIEISFASDDGESHVAVAAHLADGLPTASVFASLQQASDFFEAGSIGYSATGQEGRFDGLELCCHGWKVEPIEIESLKSSFFDDRSRFPAGSARLDCSLLMRGIQHEWHGEPQLCCSGTSIA